MIERGHEGVVAKDETSPYEGGPTMRWMKVKQKAGPSKGSMAAADQYGATLGLTVGPELVQRGAMDPHERATSVWYRVAGLLRRKELAIDIVESEIRSAQHEVWLEASKLVLTGAIEIARRMRDRAERVIKRE